MYNCKYNLSHTILYLNHQNTHVLFNVFFILLFSIRNILNTILRNDLIICFTFDLVLSLKKMQSQKIYINQYIIYKR